MVERSPPTTGPEIIAQTPLPIPAMPLPTYFPGAAPPITSEETDAVSSTLEVSARHALSHRVSHLQQNESKTRSIDPVRNLPSAFVARALSLRAPSAPEARQTRFWKFVHTLIDADNYRYNPDVVPQTLHLSGAATQNAISPFTAAVKHNDMESGKASTDASIGSNYNGGLCSCLPSPFPKLLKWITYGNFVVCILTSVLIVEIFTNKGFSPLTINPLFGVSIDTMTNLGGTVTSWLKLHPSQNWYRLFTGPFLHSGIIHLLVNASAILVLCPKLHAWLDPGELCDCGSFWGCVWIDGAILADNVVNWRVINHPRFQMVYWAVQMALFLLVGLAPFVDNLAHVGGALTGFAIGLIVARRVGGYQYHNYYLTYILYPLIALFICLIIFVGGLYVIVRNAPIQSQGLCYGFLTTSC
ncbi:hypothetical protein BC829DRAFT_442357 [Chytridium lagenaria]|nr:hypothetical protein BC829DRAFT_442357 [Chytridium lagenaria]